MADDSGQVRRMLGQLLAALPQFNVVGEAKDGLQALKAVSELRPDILILDIRMPKFTGLEVLTALQEQGSTCKVLVFSQLGEKPYREKCFELGAQGFFEKVSGFDQFHRTLKKMR